MNDRRALNLADERYGRLLVRERAGVDNSGKTLWLCLCDCGNQTIVRCSDLRSGKVRSCRCLHRELLAAHSTTHGHARKGKQHPLYSTWKSMRTRCNNSKAPQYKHYGGRGITVCERWDDFEAWLADMGGSRPEWATGGMDRINNSLGYFPENVRWSTAQEQKANQRSCIVEEDNDDPA